MIAVDGRRSVVVVNEPPTDGERLGAGSPRARVGDGLVAAFERACPAERAADRRSVQRAVLGRYFNAGSGVRARVSKREVRDLRLPDQVPGSPFGGGRHVVVGPVDDAGSPLLTEACHQASGVWMDSRPVYVCGSGWFAGVPDGFALLDSEGKALAVATRSSDAPFASLKLSRSEWKPLVLPGALRLADVGFCYGGEAAGRNGCLELAARPSRGGGFEIRLSEAWTEPIEVAVRNARLGPFDLRVRPEDPTARPQLELTWSRPKVRCLGVGAANDVACEAIVRADGFDDYLWAWANHARDCGEIVPDYAAPSSVCPRLSQDGRAIEIEDASVRWLRFGLRVSTARTRETEPAAFWTLRVAGAGDGPAAGAAAAGSGLHLDRRGTVEAFRLASLLGAREEATIVAHAAGSRFVGYGPVALGVLREALQRPVRDGSPFALRAAASPAPLSIALTPDLTKRFAPLLEIETRDGAVVRAIGEVDRFGAEPDRVEDGRAGGGGALGAPSILTVRPRGLSAHRRLPIERSALRPVIDALRQPEELERCLALHAAFAAGAAEAGGPSPPGVDLYAPEGPVALRWRDGDGRWRVSVPATSDLSTAFRSAPEAPRDGLQIWRAGEGWRDFADRDACTAPPPPGVVADRLHPARRRGLRQDPPAGGRGDRPPGRRHRVSRPLVLPRGRAARCAARPRVHAGGADGRGCRPAGGGRGSGPWPPFARWKTTRRWRSAGSKSPSRRGARVVRIDWTTAIRGPCDGRSSSRVSRISIRSPRCCCWRTRTARSGWAWSTTDTSRSCG